jgi:hypothetical protein
VLVGTFLAFVDDISHDAGNDAQQSDEHEPVVVAEAREIEQGEQGHSRIYERKAQEARHFDRNLLHCGCKNNKKIATATVLEC